MEDIVTSEFLKARGFKIDTHSGEYYVMEVASFQENDFDYIFILEYDIEDFSLSVKNRYEEVSGTYLGEITSQGLLEQIIFNFQCIAEKKMSYYD